MLDLASIYEKVKISGISKVELKEEEVELILNTLVFDGHLEDVQSSILLITGYAAAKKMYKVAKPMSSLPSITYSPCGVCPLVAQCVEGGIVSPDSCEYMAEWLNSIGDLGLVPPDQEQRILTSNSRNSFVTVDLCSTTTTVTVDNKNRKMIKEGYQSLQHSHMSSSSTASHSHSTKRQCISQGGDLSW